MESVFELGSNHIEQMVHISAQPGGNFSPVDRGKISCREVPRTGIICFSSHAIPVKTPPDSYRGKLWH